MIKLWQYPQRAHVFVVSSAPEVITVDKWGPSLPHRNPSAPARASAALAMAAAVFVPVAPFPERVQLDKFEPRVSQPLPLRARSQDTSSSFVRVITAAENVTVDKWQASRDIPARRQQVTQDTNSAFLNIIVGAGESDAKDIRWRTSDQLPLTRQRLAQDTNSNFFVLVSTPEAITTDKWVAHSPQPQRARAFVVPQTLTVNRVDVGYPQVIPAVNQPLFSRKQLTAEGYSVRDLITRLESVSLDRFQQPQSSPRFDLRRNQFSYPTGTLSGLPIPTPETVTTDKWATAWPQPQRTRPTFITQGVGVERIDTGFPQVIPEVVQPRFDLKRSQWVYPTAVINLVPIANAEVLTVDKWQRLTPDLIFRAKRLPDYGSFTSDPRGLGESVSLDRFQQPQSVPRFDLKRVQSLYAVAVSDYLSTIPGAEIITVGKWLRQTPDLIFRLKRLPDYGYLATDPRGLSEQVSLDRFQQPQSLPRFDIQRRQSLYPASVSDYLSTIPGAEIITVGKWLRQTPDLVSRLRRINDYTQFSIDPTRLVVALDKFNARAVDVLRTRAFIRVDVPFLFTPAAPTTFDKWVQPYTEVLRKRRQAIESSQQVLLVSESITLDKWIQEQRTITRPRVGIQTDNQFIKFIPAIPVAIDKWLHDQGMPVRRRHQVQEGWFSLIRLDVFYSTIPDPQRIFIVQAETRQLTESVESRIVTIDAERSFIVTADGRIYIVVFDSTEWTEA